MNAAAPLGVALHPERGLDRSHPDAPACLAAAPPLSEGASWRSPTMMAIGIIFVFVIALGVLNLVEFGRVD